MLPKMDFFVPGDLKASKIKICLYMISDPKVGLFFLGVKGE
jgi:hypothetical protein